MERTNWGIGLPAASGCEAFDPLAMARNRRDTVNRTPGTLTGYDCPDCLNRGYSAHIREDGSLYTVGCKCVNIRRCKRQMEASGLKNALDQMQFANYTVDEEWQRRILAGAKDFAGNPTGWILFAGQPGAGKTHLLVAVCSARLNVGDEVRYASWRDTVADLKSAALDSEKRSKTLAALKCAQVLFIDDFFKGRSADGNNRPTPADVNLAFELLNHRYVNRLTTMISTELEPEDLLAIDEALGSRIIEMAKPHTFVIARHPKRNYRLRGMVSG